MRHLSLTACAWLLLVCASVVPAHAEGDRVAAARLYTEAKKLYDIGEYQQALDTFKRAYLAFQEPSFLFNMGHCYRALGNAQEAIRSYKSYLRNVPAAANGAEVERIIHQLDDEVAEQRHAATAPVVVSKPAASTAEVKPATAALTATAAPPPPRKKRLWVWPVVGGVVAAGVAVGLGVGLTVGRPSEASLTPVQY